MQAHLTAAGTRAKLGFTQDSDEDIRVYPRLAISHTFECRNKNGMNRYLQWFCSMFRKKTCVGYQIIRKPPFSGRQ